MTTTTPAIPGLSYRVRVEHHGLGYAPEGATWNAEREVATFDYLRVTGDSIEDALARVEDHHREATRRPDAALSVFFLGYNIDDRPVPSPLVLASFTERDGGGYEWEVGFYGSTSPNDTTRWRTDHHGQGLWRWGGPSGWTQVRGHLQYEVESREWLVQRWGLTEGEVAEGSDLLTSGQVREMLAQLGRPISAAALRNYGSRPPAGWPQPVQHVGRTPLWSRTAIEAYARAGAGQ